jgi:hypothetical protein
MRLTEHLGKEEVPQGQAVLTGLPVPQVPRALQVQVELVELVGAQVHLELQVLKAHKGKLGRKGRKDQ